MNLFTKSNKVLSVLLILLLTFSMLLPGNVLADDEIPPGDELMSGGGTPAGDEAPGDDASPGDDEAPTGGESPGGDEAPTGDGSPAGGEAPASGEDPADGTTVPVASIGITGTGGATEVIKDQTLLLSAQITPAEATNPSVSWSVVNGTGTAFINDSGLLTGTGEGTVTVIAAANDGSGVQGSIEITVIDSEELLLLNGLLPAGAPPKEAGPLAPPAPDVVNKTATSVTLAANADHEFCIDDHDANTENIWQDSNVFTGLTPATEYTFIARVKETDTRLASDASPGTTVTTNAEALPAVTSVSIDPNAVTVTLGNTRQLTANVTVEGGAVQTVTWSSSDAANPQKVTVDETGLLCVAADALPGNYTITATATADNSKTGTCLVTVPVPPVPVTGVTLDRESLTLVVGGAGATLTATVEPEDATNTNVTWSSDDEDVATVQNGTVNPVGAGATTITVRTEDRGFTDTCQVTVQPPTRVMEGTVGINGTAKFGADLNADISGITYNPDDPAPVAETNVLTYQWVRNSVNLDGSISSSEIIDDATQATYRLAQEDIGRKITVTVTADGNHATGSLTSLPSAVVAKEDGPAAPAQPVMQARTSAGVTLTAVAGQEYSKDNGATWQDSNEFAGLAPGTSYAFVTRVKETDTTNPSVISEPAVISTLNNARALLGTTIGTLVADPATGVKGIPAGTKVSLFRQGLTVSPAAAAEILAASGGAAVTDQENTDVATGMVIKVTAEDGTSAEYSIALFPVITPAGPLAVAMDEDSAPLPFSLTLNANTSGTWSIKTGAENGIAAVSNTPSSSQAISYSPDPDYNGPDSFVAQIVDQYGDQAEVTINITIRPRNDAPVNTAPPAINGNAYRGSTLSATSGDWNDNKDTDLSGTVANLSYSYQWQRAADSSGTDLTDIEGATSENYTIQLPDQSRCLRVKVTAQDDRFGEPAAQSAEAYSTWLQIDANTAPDITEGPTATVTMDEDSDPVPFALTLHATDKENDTITWRIKTAAANGTAAVSVTPAGTSQVISYTTEEDYNGTDSFIVEVSDGQGGRDEITVQVTVEPVNDKPAFTPGANVAVAEDSGSYVAAGWANPDNIKAGPANENAQELEFQVTANTNEALFSVQPAVAANGALTFNTAENAFGEATITLVLKDNGGTAKGGSDTSIAESFTITVTPVNNIPSFTKGPNVGVEEDSAAYTAADWATNISKGPANESDQTLEFIVSNNNNALFEVQPRISSDGTLTFTPAADANGIALVSVYARDFGGAALAEGARSATQTFTINLSPLNDAPTITAIGAATINEDQSTGLINFTVGDVDNTVGLLTVTATSSDPTVIPDASIIISGTSDANRNLNITPLANQFGSSVITVTVSDGTASVSTTFNLTVNPVNDIPTITSIADQTINEDTSTGTLTFTVGDVETALNNLTVMAVSNNPDLFAMPIAIGGSGANRSINLTPVAQASGSATITVTVTDRYLDAIPGGDPAGEPASKSTQFQVTVNTLNDMPTISAVGTQNILEDAGEITVNFTVNDVETPAADLQVTASSNNQLLLADGSLILDGNGTNRQLRFRPAANQNGSADITITVKDTNNPQGTGTRTFRVNVTPVNDAPTIADIPDQTGALAVAEDTESTAIAFTVGDIDNNAPDLAVTASSNNPGLIPQENIILSGSGTDRTVKLLPLPDANGTATITVTVSDGALTAADTFQITVNPVNDKPELSNIADQVINENTTTAPSATADLAFTIEDVDTGDVFELTGSSNNQTLVPDANIVFGGNGTNRTVKVTPALEEHGEATITITVNDGNGGADQITFVVQVVETGGGGAAVISYIRNQLVEEDTATGDIYFTVSEDYPEVTVTAADSEVFPADNITCEKVGAASGGRQSWKTKLIPRTDANSATGVTITVTAKKEGSADATRNFNVKVTPVNDLPVVEGHNFSNMTEEDGAQVNDSIVISDADYQTPVQNLRVRIKSTNLILFPAANVKLLDLADTLLATPASTDPVLISTVVNRKVQGSFKISIQPAPDRNGTGYIVLEVFDGLETVQKEFRVDVLLANDAPTITPIANQTLGEDNNLPPVGFTVGDVETEAGNLLVWATSSNTDLIPDGNITIGGSGANRTITLRPAANMNSANAGGISVITLHVKDGDNTTTTTTFEVTVDPVNDAPYIGNIANQTILEDQSVGPIAFTIGDIDSPIGDLTVSATSSNPALITDAGITLGGSGANRTITLRPLENANYIAGGGTATISVRVSDGLIPIPTTRTFNFKVLPVNDAPTVVVDTSHSKVDDEGNIAIDEDSQAQGIGFTIHDVETPTNVLRPTVRIISGNEVLLPNDEDHIQLQEVAGSNGANWKMTLIPAANQNGAMLVVVEVTDDVRDGVSEIITTQKNIEFNVTSINDLPVISTSNDQVVPVPDQTILEDAQGITINFFVRDIETEAGSLVVSATSSNQGLVPAANILLGGSGSARSIKLTPLPEQNGQTVITLRVNDGRDTTEQTFILNVTPVNDQPSFSKGANQTVNEDSGQITINNWATALSKGPANENGQTLEFVVNNDNNPLFNSQPAVSPEGTLTFTPRADAHGIAVVSISLKDNGGTDNGGVDASAVQTFTITVNPINDVPVFTKGGNQTVNEDCGAQTVENWAAGISPGPANESGQTLSFILTNNNNALFSVQPGISAAGTITYTPAANAYGTAEVSVSLKDNGGTANGGTDTSAVQTFTITVNPVNDVPSFTKGANQTVNEDSGAKSVTNWATGISKGPANESDQTIEFLVSNNNEALFSSQPAVAANGTLTYTLAANQSGTATVTVQIKDSGGTANGGTDTSPSQTFTITVRPVNEAPSFSKGAEQTVNEDAAAVTVNNWATDISPGPSNESTQTVSFTVTNNNNALFNVQPAVSATGTLTFTPAANAYGSAVVSVSLKDNGGTANGGHDTSAVQTFNITINPVNDVPSFTKGADQDVNEDTGNHTIGGWATGISKGPANENAQTIEFIVDNNNNDLFSIQPSIAANGTLIYTLAANQHGSAEVTVRIKDNGGTENGGTDTSDAQTFTITANPVNEAPSFTLGADPAIGTDQTVNEDSPAVSIANFTTDISPGPANESSQTVNFDVTNNNNNLFGAQPMLSADGTLTYTPAADVYGSVLVTVTLKDNGGTANGGQDTSAEQTFTITINPVNDVPCFTKGAGQTVNEDSGAHTIANWATGISKGPANENTQTIDFIVGNDNNSLFTVDGQPAVAANGTLTYTLAANQSGTATMTVAVKDNGGTDNGGDDTSDDQTFTITVNPVNEAPTFTKGGDQIVDEDCGPRTVTNWPTAISPGPANENTQTINFIVSNDNNSLFSVQPGISADGALIYTPAPDAHGSAVVTVSLKDNGGTANGGHDTSPEVTFAITVNSVLDDDEAVADTIRKIKVGFSDPNDTWESVTSTLYLIRLDQNETDVIWESSLNDVVDVQNATPGNAQEGSLLEAQINRQAEDKNVIITATVSKGSVTRKRTFLLVIKSANAQKTTHEEKIRTPEQELGLTFDVLRTTTSDGNKHDKLIIGDQNHNGIIDDEETDATEILGAMDQDSDTASIALMEDPANPADEFDAEVSNSIVSGLANSKNLELKNDYAEILIDKNELSDMRDNNMDLFFRIIPVKEENEQNTIKEGARSSVVIPGKEDIPLGAPMRIIANYSGYLTTVTILFGSNGIELPATGVEEFLQSLAVFVEHSDGSTELKKVEDGSATIVYDRVNGTTPIGISYTIDRFSHFTILELKAASASSSGDSGAPPTVPIPAGSDGPVERMAGADRYSTAIEVSKAGWPDGADTVIIARDDDFPDSLAGVTLAYQLDGPILLTPTHRLEALTAQEIRRLKVSHVIILGGTAAVSVEVEQALREVASTVERIGGQDRFGTAALIAERLAGERKENTPANTVIAYSHSFPDALAAASYAAVRDYPILLTWQNRLPEDTTEAISELGLQTAIISGGTGVISESIENTLAGQVRQVRRIAGADRYETSAALAEEFLAQEQTHVFMATGTNFPDALTGAVLTAKKGSGILMVQGQQNMPDQAIQSFIKNRGITGITIFGGPGAISQGIESWLRENLQPLSNKGKL